MPVLAVGGGADADGGDGEGQVVGAGGVPECHGAGAEVLEGGG